MNTGKVKDTVITATEEAVKAVNDVSKEITKAAQPAMKSVKEGIGEMQEKVQPIAEKAKKAAKSASKKAEPALKTAGKTIKNAGKQAKSAIKTELYLEYGSNQLDCSEIIDRCKADYKVKHKGIIKSCKIYIKLEDKTAYYVINQIEDKITL